MASEQLVRSRVKFLIKFKGFAVITIKNFTELKSDPRSGGISATSFGTSKFCSYIDIASNLVAVWGDETGDRI